jgi:gluconokinase
VWLRRTNRTLFDGVTNWTSPASWLFGQIFGAPAASHSMASGTGLYNLRERPWDAELCDHCHVNAAQLDALNDVPLASGTGSGALRDATIFSAIGDGAASNLGSGADRPRRYAINIGTSAAVRTTVARDGKLLKRLPPGLFAYVIDNARLVLGGAISNAGNLRAWCLRELRIEGDGERALSREQAAADALTVLPFLVRERAPTWPENVPAAVTGVTAVTSAADVCRAATTATYYRLADILDSLERAVTPVDEVIVSGGVLKSPASLRILADSLGRDIQVCRELESSLRGAAVHALAHLGCEVAPLRAGPRVRHRPALTAKHRLRRKRQADFERRLS